MTSRVGIWLQLMGFLSCYTSLYCIKLCCIVYVCCTAFYCVVLHYVVSYCFVLCSFIVKSCFTIYFYKHCIALLYVTVLSSLVVLLHIHTPFSKSSCVMSCHVISYHIQPDRVRCYHTRLKRNHLP